jgi:hypothetical protein
LQNHWAVEEDGWVVIDGTKRVIWVPPEARALTMHPPNIALIAKEGSFGLDFSHCKIGEEWAQCYSPENAADRI